MRRFIPHGCVARRLNSPAIRPSRALPSGRLNTWKCKFIFRRTLRPKGTFLIYWLSRFSSLLEETGTDCYVSDEFPDCIHRERGRRKGSRRKGSRLILTFLSPIPMFCFIPVHTTHPSLYGQVLKNQLSTFSRLCLNSCIVNLQLVSYFLYCLLREKGPQRWSAGESLNPWNFANLNSPSLYVTERVLNHQFLLDVATYCTCYPLALIA